MASGLINQQYTLISAIAFARAFGAELILPKATQRNSFNDARAGVVWRTAPFGSVWDEVHLVSYWAKQGLTLHKASRMRLLRWDVQIRFAFQLTLHRCVLPRGRQDSNGTASLRWT